MAVALHHRRLTLGSLSEWVACVGRSARDAVETVFGMDGQKDEGDVDLQASRQETVLARLSCDTHRANA